MRMLGRLSMALLVLMCTGMSMILGQVAPVETDGSLHQSEIAIRLEAGHVRLRAIPLSESIIRLLTPEAYRALRGTRERFADEIDDAGTEWAALRPTIFLVTAVGTADDVPFYPDQLTVTSQGLLRRPIAVLPLSPLWNAERLSDRESVSALYVFDGVAIWEPLLIHYETSTTNDWERSLRALERERSRVRRGSAEGGAGWYLSFTSANHSFDSDIQYMRFAS